MINDSARELVRGLVELTEAKSKATRDVTCPYCGATGKDDLYMHEHHFSNCKYKPGN